MVEINYPHPFVSTDGIPKTFCTKSFSPILFKTEMREVMRAKRSPPLEGRRHDVPKQNVSEHAWERSQMSAPPSSVWTHIGAQKGRLLYGTLPCVPDVLSLPDSVMALTRGAL